MTSANTAGSPIISRVPVSVLTGYLGSGKTTLLNHILTNRHGRRYAVIVNEFSDLGIDGDLVLSAQEEVITLANGCLCCDVRGDLLRSLRSLLAHTDNFDAILIETSGLADPGPVIQTFFMDPQISAAIRLDAIVCLADARHLHTQLSDASETEAQLAAADLILLNKSDLVSEEQLDAAEERIRELNRFAAIRRTMYSSVPIKEIFDRDAFDLRRVTERLPGFEDMQPRHRAAIGSVSFRADRPLEMDRFIRWADSLIALQGEDILRIKAILYFEGHARPFVFQSVHRIMDGDFVDDGLTGEASSKLVVIGRRLDRARLRRNLEACQIPAAAGALLAADS